MDRQALTGVNGKSVTTTCFAMEDGVQDERFLPQHKVIGSALLFLMWCRRHNLDPRDMLLIAGNVYNVGITTNNEHIMALREYFKVDQSGSTHYLF